MVVTYERPAPSCFHISPFRPLLPVPYPARCSRQPESSRVESANSYQHQLAHLPLRLLNFRFRKIPTRFAFAFARRRTRCWANIFISGSTPPFAHHSVLAISHFLFWFCFLARAFLLRRLHKYQYIYTHARTIFPLFFLPRPLSLSLSFLFYLAYTYSRKTKNKNENRILRHCTVRFVHALIIRQRCLVFCFQIFIDSLVLQKIKKSHESQCAKCLVNDVALR